MSRHQQLLLVALALANIAVFAGLGVAMALWDGPEAPLHIVTATPLPSEAYRSPRPTPTSPPALAQSPAPAGGQAAASLPTSSAAGQQAPGIEQSAARFLLGLSVEGRPINGYGLPSDEPGASALVLVSGIHGDETNAWPVLQGLIAELLAGRLSPPQGVSVYVVESLNPDGAAGQDRLNANGVDLNRNWETPDWRARVEVGAFEFIQHGGGPAPFSEPETQVMRDFLLGLQATHLQGVTVIYFHAAVPPHGVVLPGVHQRAGGDLADTASRLLGEMLAEAAGYDYSNQWVGNYEVTGDADSWAVAQGLRALTVELPTRLALNPEEAHNLRAGILTVLDALGEP